MIRFTTQAAAALALAAALIAAPALAETTTFRADLKGASEVPPVAGAGGTGTVTATYDTADRKLTWKGSVATLTGPATAAHFHGPAAAGANAGVMIPAPVTASTTGAGTVDGSATLTEAQATALMGGMTYFNVHTAANPNGEVRGQVVKAP